MEIRTVGIVGHGAFGALAHTLLKRFAPEVQVKIHTRAKKGDGISFFSLSETAKCDALILAVPIHAFEEVLKKVIPLAREDTILVDVATVKVKTIGLLKKFARNRRWLATHPVWGPESYAKRGGDIAGLRIVMCDGTLEVPDYIALTNVLKGVGFDVVEMTAEKHDKHLAETLFLTHFVGQIVARGGFERTQVDTVSFGFLMDAVESVRHDAKLFADVFRFNPYCKDVLARFAKAERDVRLLLESPGTARPGLAARIGVAGARGSFSEEAARAYAKKNKLKAFTLEYLVSVENVLSALENGKIDLGIFPIENSTGGVVTETVSAMAKHNFELRKMFDIEIHQNLLVRKGVARERIKIITSHEQALMQCKSYLKREWKKAKVQEYEDTAKAAEDLAKGKLPTTTAVIASRAAAKLYKLAILDSSIQDLKRNLTTFIAATSSS